MALNIGSFYGLGRQVAAELNKMAKRVHDGLDASVPATPFPDRLTIDRSTVRSIDRMCQAISVADGRKPSVCFGRNAWSMSRVTTNTLIKFEQRLTQLGK